MSMAMKNVVEQSHQANEERATSLNNNCGVLHSDHYNMHIKQVLMRQSVWAINTSNEIILP
jgi:hypothetical protein